MEHSRQLNYPRFLRLFAVLFCLFSFVSCGTFFSPMDGRIPLDKVKIASTFTRIEITQENLGKVANWCIPYVYAGDSRFKQELQDFPSNKIKTVSNTIYSKRFIYWKTTGICLEQSSAGFPIFAAEMFLKTINPNGVPDEIAYDWYKQMAFLIARQGTVRVAYVYSSGNAYIANYWVDKSEPQILLYSMDYMKSGTWEMEKTDIRFTHPDMKGITESEINYAKKKYILGPTQ